MNRYVLITGASAGLGAEFARQLAKQGYSLLLLARREDKLKALQNELLMKHSQIKVTYLATDLSLESSALDVLQTIQCNKISLFGLINNAGFGARGAFSELDQNKQNKMLQVNINSLVSLTHLCLPLLKQQSQSFIINVASTAAFQAGPNLAVYYASKAFVLSFSEALYEELKGQIRVSALCPGATNTEFAVVAGMSDSLMFKLRVMDKQSVVSYALAHLDKAIVIPGWVNKTGAFMAKLAPRFMTRKIAYLIQK